jgi:hypothetical protein
MRGRGKEGREAEGEGLMHKNLNFYKKSLTNLK